jgi:hypothetical protein
MAVGHAHDANIHARRPQEMNIKKAGAKMELIETTDTHVGVRGKMSKQLFSPTSKVSRRVARERGS